MQHRHLNHADYSLAAIDDVIARGGLADWFELRAALGLDPELSGKVLRICKAHIGDPYAQRFHFWNNYVHYLQSAA